MKALFARIRRLVTSAAGIYLAATVLARAGSIVLIPFYTRKLSLDHFGDYAIAQTIVQLAVNMLSLGTIAAVGRFYFDGSDLQQSTAKSGSASRFSIALTVGISLVCQAVILLVGGSNAQRLGSRWELSCMLWAGAGTFVSQIPLTYLRSAQRPVMVSVLNLFQFLTSVAAGLVLVAWMGRQLRGTVEAMALSAMFNAAIAAVYVAWKMPGRISRAIARESLIYSLPFVPHLAALQVANSADRWVMKTHGDVELGPYALAGQLTTPTQMVLGAWNEADAPRMGEEYRQGGRAAMAKGFRRTVAGYVLAALLPGIATVIALPLLRAFVGQKFGGTLWPTPVLAFLLVIDAFYFPSVNVLSFVNQTRIIPVVTAIYATVNAGLNILLIPMFGIPGALVARGVSSAVRSTLVSWFARRALKEEA